MRVTNHIFELKDNEVFVFGSNELGVHGKGAAKTAKRWGAKHLQASGLMGQTYGIPTVKKLRPYTVLSVAKIKKYVDVFILFAKENKDRFFLITEIGCGLAGHSVSDIAPLFKDAMKLDNISMPKKFWDVLYCL
jgi:hypothetical protein